MKKLIAVLVIISIYTAPFTALAQEAGKARIIGGVVDSENSQPVEFANIALLSPDTGKPVDGAVCDDKGKFTLSKVAAGTYDLSVSFIGYETQTLKNITVPDKREDINVGLIKLSTGAKVLTEVTVTGQKQLLEEKVDRLVYNAENDQTSRGGDATDVLKRVPMLSVDLDGNVSMRGSSNIQVLINNKPSTIMASSIADALKQIPADQIKTVEVITSPSAKYDAEGSGGIINIITKKNTLQGLTLNLDAGVGLRGSNLGLNGNYRRGKMGFSLGGWGRANYNVNGRFESTQSTLSALDDNTPTINSQSADTRSHGLFGNYNIGWDYDINEKNFMTASVRLGARNNTSYQDNFLTTVTDNDGTRSSLRNAMSEDLNNNIDANLSYTHLYAKPQRELSIMGSYSRNNRNNDFYNNILGESSAGSNRNNNDSYNEETTVQVDYQTPIGETQMVEFGAKDIMRRVYSNYNYFLDSNGDGIYEQSTNTAQSNNLNYDQNVVAGYLSYTKSFKNGFSTKVGSRYEYTTINAYTLTDADIEIPAYGALVPSINLSQKLSNGKTLKASYNRRIQRPSVRYLNPNVQASNPYDVSFGNPTLNPEYTNNFELSYSTFVKATSINVSAFWRNTNNAIQEVRTVETVQDTLQRVSTTYNNIGRENAVGTNIFLNVSIGKLSLNGGTDLYYSMLNNNVPVDASNPNDPNRQFAAKNSGWVASYRMFGNYNLTKGWGFQFFGFYRGRSVQLQGTQGNFGIYSLGLKKDFNNKKGSIGFGAENFFTPKFKIRSELNSPLVTRTSVNEMRTMSFRINVSYRIGKMSMEAPKRRRSVNNDDLKDEGGGGGDNGGGGMGGGQAGGGRQGGGRTGGGNNGTAAPAALKPADASAVVNPEGTWNYTVESPQGGEGTLVLKKEGDTYTGTINNKRFNKENPISSVSLKGNELTFSYEVNFGGNAMMVTVKAIVSEKSFEGNMTVGQFGTFPIKGTKAQ
jgi:outer membrane receptor protein involved in Fe transport